MSDSHVRLTFTLPPQELDSTSFLIPKSSNWSALKRGCSKIIFSMAYLVPPPLHTHIHTNAHTRMEPFRLEFSTKYQTLSLQRGRKPWIMSTLCLLLHSQVLLEEQSMSWSWKSSPFMEPSGRTAQMKPILYRQHSQCCPQTRTWRLSPKHRHALTHETTRRRIPVCSNLNLTQFKPLRPYNG